MTTMLPPARDLPPGRQAEIRAAVEKTVTRRRRAMRLATVATALAAAAAVVVVLLPKQPTSGYWATRPVLTGLTPEQVEDIEEGCWKAARAKERPTLHLYRKDDAGAVALLYTTKEALDCDLSTPGQYYSGWQDRGKNFDTRWLTGHFSIDMAGQRAGDPVRNIPGFSQIGGRVDSQVKRMTYTLDGTTVEADIANGAFLARILRPTDWHWPQEIDRTASVKAYDAEGNLIGDSLDIEGKCFVDWEGNIIHGGWDPNKKPEDCLTAEPWR
ncbi:hypothetical protein [Lentzea flava]|uniref:Uncharacterized protein n=1 Tax=Lentzea flava TaxID=103732 RepID=A0ABQ2VGS2_9PSEU|nr:hypothetical protein [Lentzea flava]MCP2205329.1 hypothetical protein [Lentzea flava]GGU85878.1 hypothetical protein GCM10010178_89980 [Lentzea flava]